MDSSNFRLRDKNVKILLVSTLVVIIVLAVVMIVYQAAEKEGPIGPSEIRLKCSVPDCGYEWTVSRTQYAKLMSEAMPMLDPNDLAAPPPDMGGPQGVNCPKCGTKRSAYPMTECPKCHKFFLSAAYTDPNAMMNPDFREICPWCDVDINEYWRQKVRERLNKK